MERHDIKDLQVYIKCSNILRLTKRKSYLLCCYTKYSLLFNEYIVISSKYLEFIVDR